MLEVRGLTVQYGDRLALDGVDLDVADGEVVCVLGPSGSGKSTLLRSIAGLEVPRAGRVVRDGIDLAEMPPHQRDLGLMFQDHALFPHRDVLGNVSFGPRMHGADRAAAEERARTVLGLVGLTSFEHRAVSRLSGGEQQRVALARALAAAPRLLMLDEPLGALDRELREHLADELRKIFDTLDLSVLFVTHDHDEAFALGDRVAVMHEGRIEQIGTSVDVWRRPATSFVARFLGWNVTRALGDRLCAVRPDAVSVASSRVDGTATLAATVAARTFRRDYFRVLVTLDATGESLEAAIRGDTAPAAGEHVDLVVDDDGIVPLSA
jgi:thiamine transport system ATP-binding protein